jgi:signal transduction histidine kinase
MWGGLRVEVALRPSLAPRLVIGGLPRSRLPVVGALLAVTTVLVLTAAVQLRRERELAQLREEFVAGASHELRTPLAQIRLFTETLRLGRVRTDAERDRSLEIIDQETRRLSHLVENLLYVSRAGRGMMAVSPRDQDVAGNLRDAVEAFGPIAAARRNHVAVDAPERLEGLVDADAFRQIVLNLVDNAIKYGPEGQTVTVRLARDDGLIRLTVDDQGPGVPPAERLRIFERFVRLERDRDANTTGTGLGLALVLELAGLHGGRAWAEDAPGGGARMTVEWPQSREA